jgi:eukaryotic translation initiation factor 2-alpha kinase 3
LLIAKLLRLEILGKGGFGTVYLARSMLDGANYAVKKIVLKAPQLRYYFKEKKFYKITNEIKVLARMDHHHITRYHHCWIEVRPCSLRGGDHDASK